MRKPQPRRLLGWVGLGALVASTCVLALLRQWEAALILLTLLVGADVALALDHRVRLARTGQASRSTLGEQRALRDEFRKLRTSLTPLGEVVENVRERDRRLMGILERERLVTADRDRALIDRLEALERALEPRVGQER